MWRPEPEDGRCLLAVARAAIARAVGAPALDLGLDAHLSRARTREALRREAAVFVTLRMEHALRGCLGTLEATEPLAEAVARQAVAAALEDPRFPPLRPAELVAVRLRVSVLGPFVSVASAEEIVPGRHGLHLTLGSARAVFLPEVASEQGWDRLVLLENLAVKAGLRRDDWREAALSAFESATFVETLY